MVRGGHWTKEVDIDESIFEKNVDMAFEAMTQAMESFFEGEVKETYEGPIGLGWVMMACEEGCEGNAEKEIVSLTEHVLRNAGYYTLADEAKRVRKKHQSGEEI